MSRCEQTLKKNTGASLSPFTPRMAIMPFVRDVPMPYMKCAQSIPMFYFTRGESDIAPLQLSDGRGEFDGSRKRRLKISQAIHIPAILLNQIKRRGIL